MRLPIAESSTEPAVKIAPHVVRSSPVARANPNSTLPASAKRIATLASGDIEPIWNVIAYRVVPHVSTQTAKSCHAIQAVRS